MSCTEVRARANFAACEVIVSSSLRSSSILTFSHEPPIAPTFRHTLGNVLEDPKTLRSRLLPVPHDPKSAAMSEANRKKG